QREKFRNEYQIEFAESTFCDIIANTVFWLRPVYDLQKNRLIQSTYIQADETPIPVLTKGKNGKTHKGFYWVYYDPVFKNV
ncbi:transposase, partial [Klebsiella pneumoniae]